MAHTAQDKSASEWAKEALADLGTATPSQIAAWYSDTYGEPPPQTPGTLRNTLRRLVLTGALEDVADEHGAYRLPQEAPRPRVPSEAAPRELRGSEHRDPVYDVFASAGDGGVVVREEPIGYITGPDALSRPGRRVGWFPVRGDSMGDLYRRGMLVPIQFFDEHPKDVHEDDVYLFRLEHAIQLKRLQRLPGHRLRIISDNPRYVPVDIEITEGTDFEILGRVLS